MYFFGSEFPYTNIHELNLDWLIRAIRKLYSDFETFANEQSIKYADPIEWSLLSEYLKNTVVMDGDGTIYISKQDVPKGTPLDNEDYWFRLGNIDDILSRLDALEAEIANIKPQNRMTHFKEYYINNTTGDDNYDGLTEATAFKTINKFLSMSDQFSQIAGHFVHSGDYEATGFDTITDCDIRMFGDVSDVTIIMPGRGDDEGMGINILNSHFRVESANLVVKNGARVDGNLIGVNTVINLSDVNFENGTVECYGGEFNCVRTNLQRMICHNSFVRIHHAYIMNTDPDINAYTFANCTVEMRSSCTTEPLTADSETNAVIKATGSHIAIMTTFISDTTSGHRYYVPIDAGYCSFIIEGITYTHIGDNTCFVADHFVANNLFKEHGVNP